MKNKTNVRHEVGDKVIALTNPKTANSQPRKKGQIYIVKAIKYCPYCGIQAINIGQQTTNIIVVCKCGKQQNTTGLKWTQSHHFVKPQELKAKIEEAVEIEDYETAHELHQLL